MATFDDPGLDRLWDALARRLQRNGLAVKGSVTLSRSHLPRAVRVLAGLMGRPVDGDRARLDLKRCRPECVLSKRKPQI